MKLLLDTHIWIWSQLEPWRISSEVTKELGDPRNELWLSPVSIWELVLLVEKKRIEINSDMGEWVQRSVRELDLLEAPFNSAVAHELTLVTADLRLQQLPDLQLLANR